MNERPDGKKLSSVMKNAIILYSYNLAVFWSILLLKYTENNWYVYSTENTKCNFRLPKI